MINCTKVDLVKLAQEAYRLSKAQGLGFLHFTSEPLSKEEAEQYMHKDDKFMRLSMDYVHGRAVKLTVRKEKDGELSLPDSWYDHTNEQYKELLHLVGIETQGISITEHGCACNCTDCREKEQ